MNKSNQTSATLVLTMKRKIESAPSQEPTYTTAQLSPIFVTIPPHGLYVLAEALTLEGSLSTDAGVNKDAIFGTLVQDVTDQPVNHFGLDYVISGLERD